MSQQPRARTATVRSAPVTRALILSLVATWMIQLAFGWDESQGNVRLAIRLGANFSALVAAGEWDRLVTANWLHGYWFHLILNALGLWVLGRSVELLLGGRRLFILFVLSCLGGAAASAWNHLEMPSMGASTGVAGLFAALGVILFAFRARLPPQTARFRKRWLVVLALQVGLEVLMETPLSPFPGIRIDHAGHLGGFVVGGLSTIWLLPRQRPAQESKRWRVALLPGAIALLIAAAFVQAGLRIATGSHLSTLRLLRAARVTPYLPSNQNLYAWEVATDPEATRPELEAAEQLAAAAVENFAYHEDVVDLEAEAPRWWSERSALVDTHATLLFRLGHQEAAVRRERDALEAPVPLPEALVRSNHSQLARFLAEHLRAHGPLVDVALPLPSPVMGDKFVEFAVPPRDVPLELWLLLFEEDNVAGLVRALAPASPTQQPFRLELKQRGEEAATSSVVIAWLRKAPLPGDQEAQLEGLTLDPSVLRLPGPLSPALAR